MSNQKKRHGFVIKLCLFFYFIQYIGPSVNCIVVFEKIGVRIQWAVTNRGKLNKQHQLSSTFIFLISGAVATCKNVHVVTARNILLILIFES